MGAPRTEADQLYKEQLRLEIEQRHLASIVRLVGPFVGAPLIEIGTTSALLVTTQLGSLDKVVLEALACETPVLALDPLYQSWAGVRVTSLPWTDQIVDGVIQILRKPSSCPEGRQAVFDRANLRTLVARLDKEFFD